MKTDLMRKIDFWIGVPLCLLLSLGRCICRITEKQDRLNKTLFIQLSEMGSAVLAYPAVKYLQTSRPRMQSYYLIFKNQRTIIDLLGLVPPENILTIRNDGLGCFFMDTLRVLQQIRDLKIDAVVDLELFSRFSSLVSVLSKAPLRAGFVALGTEGLYRGNFLTHAVSYNCHQHISYNFSALVKSLTISPTTSLLKQSLQNFDLTLPHIKSECHAKIALTQRIKAIQPDFDPRKPIVVINPNASRFLPLRKWPLEYYVRLNMLILKKTDAFIVVIGSTDEKKDAQTLCKAVTNSRCIDFSGQTSLPDLITLFNIASILISNDSGTPNFASLTKIKIIVLFGPETPQLYRPLGPHVSICYSNFACSPCVSAFNHRYSSCNDNQCLQAITPEHVFLKLTKKLKIET